jgi:hypothetical protein
MRLSVGLDDYFMERMLRCKETNLFCKIGTELLPVG